MNTKEILEVFGDFVWMPEDHTNCLFSYDGHGVVYLEDGEVYSISKINVVSVQGNLCLAICCENGDRFQAIFDWSKKVDDVYDYIEDEC